MLEIVSSKLGNTKKSESVAPFGEYFVESRKNYEELMRRLEFERKALPLERRILLAEDLIRSGKCKSGEEVQEVQAILIDLKKQFELEHMGYKNEFKLLTTEEVEAYKKTYFKELKIAETAFQNLLDKMNSLTDKYVEEMTNLIREAGYLDISNRTFNNWEFADIVGIKNTSSVIVQPVIHPRFRFWSTFAKDVKNLKRYLGDE